MSHKPIISIKNLTKVYGTKQPVRALENISLDIFPGGFVSIVGPSGCGKSTLLRLIAGLASVTEGSLEIHGIHVGQAATKIGMVFQNAVLLPWRKITDNVLLPVDAMELKRSNYLQRARELLKLTGLEGFESRYPSELSGGMQQRVAICRALIHDPEILLMDEPFGALDALTRDIMGLELLKIWATKKRTILFVTHSVPEAIFLADKVVVLSPRPGRIVETLETKMARPRALSIRGSQDFGQLANRVFEKLGFVDTYA